LRNACDFTDMTRRTIRLYDPLVQISHHVYGSVNVEEWIDVQGVLWLLKRETLLHLVIYRNSA